MVEPGVYRIHFRAMSFAEGWRMFGPLLFARFPLNKLIGRKGGYVWLPVTERVPWCDQSALTDEALGRLAPWRAEMIALGYRNPAFRRLGKIVDARHRDIGYCVALHDDGFRYMSAQYFHAVLTKPWPTVIKRVMLTAVFRSADGRRTAVVDHNLLWLEEPERRVIRIKPRGVRAVHARLEQELRTAAGPLHRFASVDEVRQAIDEAGARADARKIERGILRRVPADQEREILARYGLGGAGQANPRAG